MNHIGGVNKMVLVSLIFVSCEDIVRKSVPLPDLLQEISEETYILNRWDCSNKAAKYFYAVKAAGYDPTLIVYIRKDGKKHTIVKVGETYIDATNASSRMMPPKGIIDRVKEEDFNKFGKEYEVR